MSIEKSPKIPICQGAVPRMHSGGHVLSGNLPTQKLTEACTPRQDHHAIDCNSSADLRLEALNNSKAQRMAEFFRLLGDGNRLRILSLLAQRDLCVCDLAGLLSMSESAVSHQLRTLRSLRLVNYEKRGRKVYYRLLDHHVLELYQSVAEHLAEVDTI